MAHLGPPMDLPRHHLPPPPATHQQSRGPPPQPNGQAISPSLTHRPPTTSAPRSALPPHMSASLRNLSAANEETWILIGNLAEQMNDPDRAESAYEHALRHNPESERALTQVASIARSRDDFPKAIEFFQRALDVRQDNGEVWSALGHCYLMQDDLQKAYAAYQQALYHLPNPKDPKLWYGIGILYDRYGSLDNAEEAFSSVLRMDANFEKAEEILFRLGIIYKQQQKYAESLDCFDKILRNPPAPLANLDIWFQIGHVYEQAKNYDQAKEAYERVLADSPNHAKVLQQLGWLYHQPGSSFNNQDLAINCLTKSLEADSSDAQSWYLLGRAYMAVQKYQKAYEAYQQAVYRDGRNPTFWCSIGVLYYNINQYRDALDAYSRAIRINPYIPEVWFDLGSLYESCNNQISDAIDAYARAADLDPNNEVIKNRLRLLKDVQANGGTMPAAPGPRDVHPTAYASGHGPPNMIVGGPPQTPVSSHPHPQPSGPSHHRGPSGSGHSRSNSRGGPSNGLMDHPMNGGTGRDLPMPTPRNDRRSVDSYRRGEEPFHGGPPPPLNIDDSRRNSGNTTIGPIELERGAGHPHYPEGPRNGGPSSGPPPPPLHHPVPQPPIGSIEMAPPNGPGPNGALPPISNRGYDGPPMEPPRSRHSPPGSSPRVGGRPPASRTGTAPSPAPPPPFHQHAPYSRSGSNYPPSGSGLPPPAPSNHHGLPYERGAPQDREGWDRRSHARNDSRNGMEPPPPNFRSATPGGPPQNGPAYGPQSHHGRPASSHSYDRRVASPQVTRDYPPDRRDTRSPYQAPYPPQWSSQQHSPPSRHQASPPHAAAPPPSSSSRRYDPRFDEGPSRRGEPGPGWDPQHPPAHHQSEGPPPPQQAPPPPDRNINGTPDAVSAAKARANIPMPALDKMRRDSQSPRPESTRATAEPPKERKKRGPNGREGDNGTPKPVKEKKERKPSQRKKNGINDEMDRGSVAPMPAPSASSPTMAAPPFKAPSAYKEAIPALQHRPSRSVDENYDDEEEPEQNGHDHAVAALMGLAGQRGPAPPQQQRSTSSGGLASLLNGPSHSPPLSRSGTESSALKRVASDEHTDGADRSKRSRIDSHGSTSSSGSPPGQSRLDSILSPVHSVRSGPTAGQSRRPSAEDSKAPSPHQLPPIATLSPEPASPAVSKMQVDGPKVPSPPSAKHSPVTETA